MFPNSVLNVKAVVATFNQEKALVVGAFSVITNLRMELFEALVWRVTVEDDMSGQKLASSGAVMLPDVLINFFVRFGKIFPKLIVGGAKMRGKLLKLST